jgi:hypothetical protein
MTPFLTTTLGKTTIHYYYSDCIPKYKLSTYEEIHANIHNNRVNIRCDGMACSKCILRNMTPGCDFLDGYMAFDKEFKNYMENNLPELLI